MEIQKILVKGKYKLVDEKLFEKIPELSPLDVVCIDIDDKANPTYTFAYRMDEELNVRMTLKDSEIKSIDREVIRYHNMPGSLAQTALRGSPNKIHGDKLYSLLETYLKEAGL